MGTGRVCPHCGAPIAADRKQYCNNCGEDFTQPGPVPAPMPVVARGELPRRIRSRVGILAGVLIALGVPLASLAVAFLWDQGVLHLEPNGPLVQMLQGAAMLEIVLGPVGIAVVGRSARLGAVGWLALIVLAVPALTVIWFVGTAYLGGLAGEPF